MSKHKEPLGKHKEPLGKHRAAGQLTPWSHLLAAGLLGIVLGWVFAATPAALGRADINLTWLAPVTLVVVAVGVGALALSTYLWVHRKRRVMEPQRGLLLVVLGKAAGLGGAAVLGGYFMFAGYQLGKLDIPGPRERAILAGFAALGGLATSIAGLLLERSCLTPAGPGDTRKLSL